MAYGNFISNKIQLGFETTPGTAVAADIIWLGPAADIVEARTRLFREAHTGVVAPTTHHYDTQVIARLAMPATAATYEHLPHVLRASIGEFAPTGAGPYVYDYPGPTTAFTGIKPATIETGNVIGGDVNEMEYSHGESFTLEGRTGEAWQVSSNWAGRQKSTSTFTGALSVAAVEEMIFQNTQLTIDDGGGTIGTTAVNGVLREASITYNTGIKQVFSADGVLYFYAVKRTMPSATFTLKVELEDGSTVETERAAYKAGTIRLIRLNCAGTSSRDFDLDLAGVYTDVGSYENDDDNTIVTFTGEARYSSADTEFISFKVTNNLTALP